MSSDYHDLRQYQLSAEDESTLHELQTECTFNWVNKAGHPLGVIMSYLARDGHFWLTCIGTRKRIPAIRRDPRTSMIITSTGTEIGPGQTITYKGTSVVHDDRETKDWFYPEMAQRLHSHRGEYEVQARIEILDTPERVIIEFMPESDIRFDMKQYRAATPSKAAPTTQDGDEG